MKLYLVDDEPLVRGCLAYVLSAIEPETIVEQFDDCTQAVAAARRHGAPDLAVIGVNTLGEPSSGFHPNEPIWLDRSNATHCAQAQPGSVSSLRAPAPRLRSGLDLRRFREYLPDVPIVAIVAQTCPGVPQPAEKFPVEATVSRKCEVRDLLAAVSQTLRRAAGAHKAKKARAEAKARPKRQADSEPLALSAEAMTDLFLEILTGRQREVLEHVLLGSSNKVIAKQLGISDLTVKTHVAKLLDVFRVGTRIELMAVAGRHAGR